MGTIISTITIILPFPTTYPKVGKRAQEKDAAEAKAEAVLARYESDPAIRCHPATFKGGSQTTGV